MEHFRINGIIWTLKYVRPNHSALFRTDGSRTVGMTDWVTRTIYIADNLRGAFLERVLCHELCHCFCFSHDIRMDITQEEYLSNWVSLYGRQVIEILDDILYQKVYVGKRG